MSSHLRVQPGRGHARVLRTAQGDQGALPEHARSRNRIPCGASNSRSQWKSWRDARVGWVRFFGVPVAVITDSRSEFKALFERKLEGVGVLQHVTLPECPWQNGRVERHGGWVKERLEKEITSGSCLLESLDDMDLYTASLTTAKNRYFSRGGFSPAQLVFGAAPRRFALGRLLGRAGSTGLLPGPLEKR